MAHRHLVLIKLQKEKIRSIEEQQQKVINLFTTTVDLIKKARSKGLNVSAVLPVFKLAKNSFKKKDIPETIKHCHQTIDIVKALLRYRPKDTSNEPLTSFSVNEIFLIYKDGRLIVHTSVIQEKDVDKELIGGMLIAIQGFVTESFMAEAGLDSFEFSGNKVVIQKGDYSFLTVVLTGIEPPFFRKEMKKVIKKIENSYSKTYENWDGQKRNIKDIKKHLIRLFRLKKKSN